MVSGDWLLGVEVIFCHLVNQARGRLVPLKFGTTEVNPPYGASTSVVIRARQFEQGIGSSVQLCLLLK